MGLPLAIYIQVGEPPGRNIILERKKAAPHVSHRALWTQEFFARRPPILLAKS